MLKVFNFETTPIVDIINDILVDSVKKGASDIHFDSHEEFMRARVRIDGQLINYTDIPQQYVRNLITRIKIISGMNITESRLPQDGAIKAKIKDVDLDLRVSSIPTSNGEKIVLRILDYKMSLSGIETLGFTEDNYKKVIDMISSPNGIILITGATGTGKSTTVYSMLQRLNKEESNIITIEDPIEMDIDGINQIQTNSEIGLTFATALRSILRQDPNVIMVGEIRDSETAKIAIRAAITGHLVLSTIHTNDALSTIERLMDMDVEKYLLGSALEGIIAQRLARRLCEKCRKKRPTTDFEKQLLKDILDQDIDEVYEANGCEECHGGYKGRIAIQEVLEIDQDIRDALSLNAKKDRLKELIYDRPDVKTLLEDGLNKALQGITSLEEIIKLIEVDDYIKEKKHHNERMEMEQNNINNTVTDTEETKVVEPIQTEPIVMESISTETNNDTQENSVEQTNNSTPEPKITEEPSNDILNFDIPSPTEQTKPEPEVKEEIKIESTPVEEKKEETETNNVVDDFYDSF